MLTINLLFICSSKNGYMLSRVSPPSKRLHFISFSDIQLKQIKKNILYFSSAQKAQKVAFAYCSKQILL